eukprot:4006759-Karenia_brevis.AAC.1
MLASPRQRNEQQAVGQQDHTKFDAVEMVRGRLQLAETGNWTTLFAKFVEMQRNSHSDTEDQYAHGVLADDGGEEWVFSKAGQK